MKAMLMIGLGGFLGANLRYFVCDWAVRRWGTQFPHGTLIVNLVGSFVIGLVLVLLAEKFSLEPYWKHLLVTGFLGAFTTFSSYMNEAVGLMLAGNLGQGLFYLLGSVGLGLIAVLLGGIVGGLFLGRVPVANVS
ncbi:MAG: fluoride efflux transporter CrcB [Anaerolineae bacterium]|nr:fluoride efflux transporter CrcB [Anaerolineae bacterium]